MTTTYKPNKRRNKMTLATNSNQIKIELSSYLQSCGLRSDKIDEILINLKL